MSDSPAASTPLSFFHRTAHDGPSAIAQSSLQESSPRPITSSPVRKKARKWTRCICGDKSCDETMDQLALLNQTDHILYGYFRLPVKPQETNVKYSTKRRLVRSINARRRECFLTELPKDARRRSEDTSYRNTTKTTTLKQHQADISTNVQNAFLETYACTASVPTR